MGSGGRCRVWGRSWWSSGLLGAGRVCGARTACAGGVQDGVEGCGELGWGGPPKRVRTVREPSTSRTVGVCRTLKRLARPGCSARSISMRRTPSWWSATASSNRRVAGQRAHVGVENWTRVARLPNASAEARPSTVLAVPSGAVGLGFARPVLERRSSPRTVARARTPASTATATMTVMVRPYVVVLSARKHVSVRDGAGRSGGPAVWRFGAAVASFSRQTSRPPGWGHLRREQRTFPASAADGSHAYDRGCDYRRDTRAVPALQGERLRGGPGRS
ncbi:hypothetical protein CURTO8I2_130056 [Curtobacterium sp. 8I-2]|nr:hypothetical protein CURTO8I2_130056 [Curtobacterium sp. 8I-2]